MTDLIIYPDSFLSAPIVRKEELPNGWTICALESGKFIYFNLSGYFCDIKESDLRWNLYWGSKTKNSKERNTLEPLIVKKILAFITKKD